MKKTLFAILFFLGGSFSVNAASLHFTTDYFGTTGATHVYGDDASPFWTTCSVDYGIGDAGTPISICGDLTTTFPTYMRNAYETSDVSLPSYANSPLDIQDFADGEYYGYVTDNHAVSVECAGISLASCMSTYSGQTVAVVKFCVDSGTVTEGSCSGGGGGGGGGSPTFSPSIAGGLLIGATTDFGLSLLAVLAMTLGIGVGVLIFRVGWSKVKKSHK